MFGPVVRVVVAAVVVIGVLGVAGLVWRTGSDPAAAGSSATAPASARPSVAVEPTASGPATSEPTETRAPSGALLPNLRSLPADEVAIEVGEAGERRLRFTSSLSNFGAGPLELVPDDLVPCPAEQRHASQRLFLDANADATFDRAVDTVTTSRTAGCMLDHPTHEHWHFEAMASYQLIPVGADEPVVSRDKVSFCLRDNVTTIGGPTGQPQHYGECTGRLSLQGINPGWVDVYRSDLPGQVLDLPADLDDGLYCLRTSADPFDLVVESSEDDNTAVVPVRITGTAVGTSVRTADFTACR